LKGFTKGKGKGRKFIPTSRKKQALSKSDIAYKKSLAKSLVDVKPRSKQKKRDIPFKPERQGARVKILTGEFAGKEGVIANVSIFSNEFGIRVDGVDNEYQTSIEFAKPEDVEFLEGDPAKKDEETEEHDFTEKDLEELSTKERSIMEGDRDEDDEESDDDPHVIPQTIFDQLQASKVNGFPFFAYTGIKGFTMMGNDTLMLKDIPRNPNHISSVTVQYDEGRDLYNLIFHKGKFPKNVPVKELDGIFFDQLSDIIVDTMGVR